MPTKRSNGVNGVRPKGERRWYNLREDWDIVWAERDVIYDIMNKVHLQPNQRVNHYRNHYELTRKDLMVKNLKRHKKALEKEGRQEDVAG